MIAACVVGGQGRPLVLFPLVIDAPYSMITITYVRVKRNAGEKGALPIGELEWLARASARIALISTWQGTLRSTLRGRWR